MGARVTHTVLPFSQAEAAVPARRGASDSYPAVAAAKLGVVTGVALAEVRAGL
jgi:hypothetical protein